MKIIDITIIGVILFISLFLIKSNFVPFILNKRKKRESEQKESEQKESELRESELRERKIERKRKIEKKREKKRVQREREQSERVQRLQKEQREQRERKQRKREQRESKLREKELREKELREKELREKELREKELREKEQREREQKEREIKAQSEIITNDKDCNQTTINTYTPKIIAVNSAKIDIKPKIKISLIDGEYRYFQNHYVNGTQYTFGFPKENCKDKRVWIGIGSQEVERISLAEAYQRIENKKFISNTPKSIGSKYNEVGYCTICNKKLRGDIYKKLCFECYTNGNTKQKRVGYCSNCNKKLRGNIYKKHCTECYYKGYR